MLSLDSTKYLISLVFIFSSQLKQQDPAPSMLLT